MPISSFDGRTFVAFADISGFKHLMQAGKAYQVLDRYYNIGYQELRAAQNCVEGIFVSDCAILFARADPASRQHLSELLGVIGKINRRMLEADLMLMSSIAYGMFEYEERIEFNKMTKNMTYGYAYLDAYLDVENGNPEIQPGQCRVVRRSLPRNLFPRPGHQLVAVDPFSRVRARNGDPGHEYFYWMVDSPEDITAFEQRYADSYNLKYRGMLAALKGHPLQI